LARSFLLSLLLGVFTGAVPTHARLVYVKGLSAAGPYDVVALLWEGGRRTVLARDARSPRWNR
jgi:hypothetical protein